MSNNNFEINYNGKPAHVERRDNQNFVIETDDKTLFLYFTQDNEGANKWFEKDTEKSNDEIKELGSLIDTYLADHQSIN
jgi:hypothetical protein